MDIESIRSFCRSLPHATEGMQWGENLLFRVGGKMFALIDLDRPTPNRLAFKCTPEEFAELIEIEGIIPAPYAARYHWVTLERLDALDASEIERLIRDSYNMVFAKLPKKVKAQLASQRPSVSTKKRKRRRLK
jgi:predicted DNA-binding protein (MmcQ/YjbR family)